ncbi:kelch domain-containing protein 2-like [Asterias rubens]|uniref:kelch domain-containing protein 2-like n=1 Tax=Asterias rubens TaxID=7604 RepID=UPI0014550616|nr:kelch domain-containing protein 2-like [Asterias rubens]XP_033628160.1 kelch domain-containing protein 2-like [Asterias rubens]XP_033628170.1 kelch domain-containing protein 2-like [Asterias rubens]
MDSAGKRACTRRKQPTPRSGHVAVTYGDLMLIWGGYSDFPELDQTNGHGDLYLDGKEVWCYNIEAQLWDVWNTRSSPPGMSGSCAACVRNHMYVFGGFNENFNSNELYRLNLKTKVWSQLKPDGEAPSPRDKLTCWAYEDKLIFFGGFGQPPFREDAMNNSIGEWHLDPTSVRLWAESIRGWNNHLYVYNITENRWSHVEAQRNQPSPRAAHGCVVLGNRGYVLGGRFQENRLNDVHFLDLDTMKWSGSLPVTGEIPVGRSWHCMAPVSNRHFLVYGGYSTDNVPLNDVWIFDVDSRTWHQQKSVPSETRMWHTAVQGIDVGETVIFGGCSNNLLNPEERSVHSRKVITLSFSPISLSRLSIEAIVSDIDVLKSELSSLPTLLQRKVELRLHSSSPESSKSHDYNLRSRPRSL